MRVQCAEETLPVDKMHLAHSLLWPIASKTCSRRRHSFVAYVSALSNNCCIMFLVKIILYDHPNLARWDLVRHSVLSDRWPMD